MSTLVIFDKWNKEMARIKTTPNVSILSMLEKNNIPTSSFCRRGICGTCMRKIIKWQELLIWLYQANAIKKQKDTILVCAVGIKDIDNNGSENMDNEIWIQEI